MNLKEGGSIDDEYTVTCDVFDCAAFDLFNLTLKFN